MMQSSFVAALLNPEAAVPSGLVDPEGRPSPKRFSVYRNNVAVSLIRVLEAGFPAVRTLVGDAFFAAMAGEFVRNFPPKTRLMMLYGTEFAEFLQGFSPVAHLGYLPDVARLEQAMRESYHSANSVAVDFSKVAGLSEDVFLACRLTFAPSARLIRSDWPVHAIWAANLHGGPKPQACAQDVLVLRPGFDPVPHPLPQGAGAFVQAVMQGQPVRDALLTSDAAFDLTELLTLLVRESAIAGIAG